MPSSTRNSTTASSKQYEQLSALFVLQAAINESCKKRSQIKYASLDNGGYNSSLTDIQRLQYKLAQTCHTDKGGNTMTALVLLQGDAGNIEILFTSNRRKEDEMQAIQKYLYELLDYVSANPEKLARKPLEKRVLWRILENCFNRVDGYLSALSTAIKLCIDDCDFLQGTTIPGLALYFHAPYPILD